MAPNVSIDKNKGKMHKEDSDQLPKIGVDSNTAGGGVWAQTSAKRDKLGELKMELDWEKGQKTLDDVATPEQALDLLLVDGIRSVVMAVDEDLMLEQDGSTNVSDALLQVFESRLRDYENEKLKESSEISKKEFDDHVEELIQLVMHLRTNFEEFTSSDTCSTLSTPPGDSIDSKIVPPKVLLHLRDFLPLTSDPNINTSLKSSIPRNLAAQLHDSNFDKNHQKCQVYYRLLLLEMVLRHSSTQWESWTTPSSADVDRAATKGVKLKEKQTLPVQLLHELWLAFGKKSCKERVEAMWKLWDHDGDTRLDQEEMNLVVYGVLTPMEDAIRQLVLESVEVWPLRDGMPPCIGTNDPKNTSDGTNKRRGWYSNWKHSRSDKKATKVFLNLLERTLSKHFEVEVETPHRLRCCYAWAEKEHQDGKIKSVLVDTSGIGGAESLENDTGSTFLSARKRYVELDPKISYAEFREVQIEHYPHLDKVSNEVCQSFKEELWVHQGKGRQNDELKREITLFLLVVSLIDVAITVS